MTKGSTCLRQLCRLALLLATTLPLWQAPVSAAEVDSATEAATVTVDATNDAQAAVIETANDIQTSDIEASNEAVAVANETTNEAQAAVIETTNDIQTSDIEASNKTVAVANETTSDAEVAGIDAPTAVSRPAPVDRDIEEIEIIGQRTNGQLRLEIQRVEEHMFSLFNDLNSSSDFDVTCTNITHTGTLIPVWECDVGYLKRARYQDAMNLLQFGYPARTEEQLYWDHREKTAEFNAEMRALALEHPELAEAMLTLNEKRNELAERERELRKSGGLLSRMFGRNKD